MWINLPKPELADLTIDELVKVQRVYDEMVGQYHWPSGIPRSSYIRRINRKRHNCGTIPDNIIDGDEILIPTFEVASNPTININDIKSRRFHFNVSKQKFSKMKSSFIKRLLKKYSQGSLNKYKRDPNSKVKVFTYH